LKHLLTISVLLALVTNIATRYPCVSKIDNRTLDMNYDGD